MSRISKLFFWVPNAITAMNLVCGSISIFFAIDGELGWASVFIFAAAVFDFFDGFSARLLKAYSSIGKELDSLADLISFGLAPAAIVFTMLELTLFGKNQPIQEIEANWSQWIVLFTSLVIPVAGAFRLAKFNTDDRQSEQFLGMPIPANAIFFASLGLILELGTKQSIVPFILNKYVLLSSVFICSFLMVSEFPMFSLKFKNVNLKENALRFFFLGTTVLLLIFLQVYALPLIIIWYIFLSIVSQLVGEK
ncbi:MAG TPA: CDP-alcohol phosphatidyltransferase family protein [Prolixibacteraceae bacterium]|nr:CDP-alcohol phosphatidyltransferase family protein [Prolixibacteraceae bacterium]